MKNKSAPLKIIVLLLILYIFQGIIIGFISAIPLYLDSSNVNWKKQGTFNFVFYPFSLKLAWAPIIDAVYISRFGRRKTWLIPIQYLLGIILFILSFYLTDLIQQLYVKLLTGIFFIIYFLLASQDICVDGWALTLLTNYNLQWASICQTVGQTIGRFIGFTVLMTFESANFTNQYIRKPFLLKEQSYGLFTIDQFMQFWAIGFLIISTGITFLKEEEQRNNHLNLSETYLSIFVLFKKQCIRQLALVFLISPIGYAATYAMTNLVLKKYGVSKETLGLIGMPLIFIKIFIPFCIIKTDYPLTWYNRAYLSRLIMCILIAIYVCFTPYIISQWYFYSVLIGLFIVNESLIYLMLVSRVGFYAQISDPYIGGTYITLLSMLGNIGASLTSSVVLYAAGWIKLDGMEYPVLVGICFIFGCIWLVTQFRTVLRLQTLPIEIWHLLSASDTLTRTGEDTPEMRLKQDEQLHMIENRVHDNLS